MIKFHSDLCWWQTLADWNGLSLLSLGQQCLNSQSSDPNRGSRVVVCFLAGKTKQNKQKKKQQKKFIKRHLPLHGVKYNIIVILKRKIQLFELCGRSQVRFEFDHSRVVTAVNRHYKAAMYL